jgi:acyl-CoA reductase-like NAD-dependent aldehyde dehydrogenase
MTSSHPFQVGRKGDEAKHAGAKLLFGGEQPAGPGAYLTAGILVDVPQDSSFTHEEIFGPIAMVNGKEWASGARSSFGRGQNPGQVV